MPARPIVAYPDPRLAQVATAVTVFDEALRGLATDLIDSLGAAGALGLTACHIGVAQRVVVLHLDDMAGPQIYVNPRIVKASTDTIRHPEASVSLPGVAESVERAAHIELAYEDLDGVTRHEASSGLLAVCHQHEIDQLDGIFWLARLSRLKRERLLKRHRRA